MDEIDVIIERMKKTDKAIARNLWVIMGLIVIQVGMLVYRWLIIRGGK